MGGIPEKMPSKPIISIILSFIIIVLIIGLAVYYFDSNEDKQENQDDDEEEIDLRISPGINNGVIVEINRIRHRGLIDIIMKPGLQWRQKPTFYYTLVIDDLFYNGSLVSSANIQDNYEPFQSWDTMLIDHKISRNVGENNTTCNITLNIVEVVENGLFGLQRSHEDIEELTLCYNFTNGRWSGDDELYDDDGYGHYLGDRFELWFNIYQTDFDHDYIPYYTEVNKLKTDPCESDLYSDPDNDGIPTTWEWFWGYDPFTWDDHEHIDFDIDGIENIEEYQMRNRFADPFQQDIYIEVDGMERGGLFDPEHVLWDESAQIVMERFSEHGISVFFDNGWADSPKNGGGEILTHHRTISSGLGTIVQYYEHHFPEERKGIFRYMIVAHASGFATSTEFNHMDFLSIDTSKEIMWRTTRRAYTDRRERVIGGAATMHELGHTLGILPYTIEGCDNFSFLPLFSKNYFDYKKTWGQYESVMNYFHIYNYSLVDYSSGENGPPYDQNDWLELYLPTFQIELAIVEDPTYEPPGKEKVVNEEYECPIESWSYNESLTAQFIEKTGNWSPIEPVKCRWKIFIRDEGAEYPSDRDVRIYAQPIMNTTIVPYSAWSLIFEGTLLDDGSIDLGNLQALLT